MEQTSNCERGPFIPLEGDERVLAIRVCSLTSRLLPTNCDLAKLILDEITTACAGNKKVTKHIVDLHDILNSFKHLFQEVETIYQNKMFPKRPTKTFCFDKNELDALYDALEIAHDSLGEYDVDYTCEDRVIIEKACMWSELHSDLRRHPEDYPPSKDTIAKEEKLKAYLRKIPGTGIDD